MTNLYRRRAGQAKKKRRGKPPPRYADLLISRADDLKDPVQANRSHR